MSFGKPKPVGQQTVTQKNEPPAWLTPYLQSGLSRADELYQQGMTPTPMSGQTQDALAMSEDLARSGAGVEPAMSTYNATLGGDYLYGGDGFNAAVDAATRRITPQVQSAFSRGGRLNSGLAQGELAGRIGDSFAGLYNQERARQQGALSMAPQMAALAYQPAQQLANVGAALEAEQDMQNNADQVNLDNYISRIGGVAPFAGDTRTKVMPMYRNRGAGLLGGAMSGAQFGGKLGSAIPGLGTAWGTGLGALGGGLLGLFS